MYRDNTLIPKEAVRLIALGVLFSRDMHYAELAEDVRHFTQRIVGPSLDLVGTPLELLVVEGLIEPVEGRGMEDNALLRITDAGRTEMQRLMTSSVRAPINDINKLIIAVKMRFLHVLDGEDRQEQVDLLVEMIERELARLTDLRAAYAEEPGHFLDWLDQDIAATRARLAWFRDLQERVA
jgi:DNA-binding PadR family transcriptional regulator